MDNSGRIVNIEIEFAEKILTELWTNIAIDSYDITAKYFVPGNAEINKEALLTKSDKWKQILVKRRQ